MTDPGVQNKELSSAVVVGSGGLREGLGGWISGGVIYLFGALSKVSGEGELPYSLPLSLSPPPLMDFCAQIQQRFDF